MIYGKCIVSLGNDLWASEDSPKSLSSTFDDRLAWWGSSGCCCWGLAAWQDVAGDPMALWDIPWSIGFLWGSWKNFMNIPSLKAYENI